MGLFFRKFSVAPGYKGYSYIKNVFQKELAPGIYRHFDPLRNRDVYLVPQNKTWFDVTGQEVLCKDNVPLRFSYSVFFQIADGMKLLESSDLRTGSQYLVGVATSLLHTYSQSVVRDYIAEVDSSEVNERRTDLLENVHSALQPLVAENGITVHQLLLRDVNFPKNIQDLLARQLESKIRAQADLENARTAVAAARALKNASEVMKGDDNIRFFQYLETMTKIASKGKHTFVVGSAQDLTRAS